MANQPKTACRSQFLLDRLPTWPHTCPNSQLWGVLRAIPYAPKLLLNALEPIPNELLTGSRVLVFNRSHAGYQPILGNSLPLFDRDKTNRKELFSLKVPNSKHSKNTIYWSCLYLISESESPRWEHPDSPFTFLVLYGQSRTLSLYILYLDMNAYIRFQSTLSCDPIWVSGKNWINNSYG